MSSNDDMDRLIDLADAANEQPTFAEFARYCDLRGRGLRSDALEALDQFLARACEWPFDGRLQFTRWVLESSNAFWDRAVILPQPLQARLVVPTLREWLSLAPQEALPHLWLGLLRCDDPSIHLENALKIDPACEVALRTLTHWIVDDVDYNQHELPAFYIHDPRVDLSDLVRAEHLVDRSAVGAWADAMREEIAGLRCRAEKWLAGHPREGDFAVH